MTASDTGTVVVTVTEYTTVQQTLLTPTSISEKLSTLAGSFLDRTPSSSPSPLALISTSEVGSMLTRSSLVRTPSISLTTVSFPKSTNHVLPSLTKNTKASSSLQVSAPASATSGLTTHSSSPSLPSGWATPSVRAATEKQPKNTLPILMMLCLILVALFFLGALVYFAWRFARGRCAECSYKDVEIGNLKKQFVNEDHITPEMMQEGETPVQQKGKGVAGRGQDQRGVVISKEDLGKRALLSMEDLEKSVSIKDDSEPKSRAPSPDPKGSDPFFLDRINFTSRSSATTVKTASPGLVEPLAKISTTSLFRHGLIIEKNRLLTLREFEKARFQKQKINIELESDTRPFWKRGLDLFGLELHEKTQGKDIKRNANEDLTNRRPRVVLQTYSNPGPAPAPPAPVDQRPIENRQSNSYNFSSKNVCFEPFGKTSSDRRSSNTVPTEYPQPQPSPQEFITVALDEELSREAGQTEEAKQEQKTRRRRRTGGYGGLTPIVPPGIDGEGPVPKRV